MSRPRPKTRIDLLSRRKFLHGVGGTLFAVPFFGSLYPRESLAAAGPNDRYLAIYQANGVLNRGEAGSAYNFWRCTAGANGAYSLSRSLSGLAAVKEHITVYHDLRNDALDRVIAIGGTGAAHWVGASSFLSGQSYDYVNRATRIGLAVPGSTLDVAIGRSKNTAIPFVNMSLEKEWGAGVADDRGSAKVMGSISYLDENTRLVNLVTSREVFNRIFGNFNPGSTPSPALIEDVFRRKRSILDFVLKEANGLKAKLNPEDQRGMDQYLDAVRGVELGIQEEERRAGELAGASCKRPDSAPFGENKPEDQTQLSLRARNMLDLAVLAFQCDLTRVATLMLAVEHSYHDVLYNSPAEVSYKHHDCSHYLATDTELRVKAMSNTVAWGVSQLQQAIVKLQAAKDADGVALLDRTLIHYGAGLGDSDSHSGRDIACVLAGHAGGLRQGKLRLMSGTLYSDFLLSIGRHMGYTGPLGYATQTVSLS